MTQWDDNSWQKEFLEMKAHSPSDMKLLLEGASGFRGAWRLGSLHQEYKIMKNKEEEK